MAQAEKSLYYRALKDADVAFEKHYREYTTAELQAIYADFARERGLPETLETPPDPRALPQPGDRDRDDDIRQQLADLSKTVGQLVDLQLAQAKEPAPQSEPAGAAPRPPRSKPTAAPTPRKARVHGLDPNEHAGLTLNSHSHGEPIEIDEHGNQWFQKEVAKPGYPKPRGRRVLREQELSSKEESIKVGDYTETFEVAGSPTGRTSEVKITLPSYQTGIYLAPGMPFKIHTYNGKRGFDLRDVQQFYGGTDLVPDSIKRCYVSTDLCYDITTTIRAVNDEHRELVLKKGI